MNRTALAIDGMTCEHCVRAVEQALRGIDGVEVERVELGSATLSYDPERVSADGIRGAIEEEGYTVREQGSAA